MNKFMKKIAFTIMLVLACMVMFTGCKGLDQSLLGNATPAVSVTKNPYNAGVLVGEYAWVAYGVCQGNEKCADEIALCEEIWQKLEAEEAVDIGTLNNLALQIGQKAVQEKYGYVYAGAIMLAVNAMGSMVDNSIAGNIDTEGIGEFLNGVRDGVRKGQAIIPKEAFAPDPKPEKKAFECPDGNCDIVVTNRNVKHQRAIAQQLIDEGWVKKGDKPREGMEESDYKNVDDFINRCATLKKYSVKTTDLYIKRFKCKTVKNETGEDVRSLENIEFKMIVKDEDTGEAKEFDVFCVSCQDVPEIDGK